MEEYQDRKAVLKGLTETPPQPQPVAAPPALSLSTLWARVATNPATKYVAMASGVAILAAALAILVPGDSDDDGAAPGQTATQAALTVPALQAPSETPESIAAIRDQLSARGYANNYLDGSFNADTADATMKFLKDNPDRVESTAPWVIEKLVGFGHRDALSRIIFETPDQWDRMGTRIQILINEPDALSTKDIQKLQGWLLALGTYNGAVDGKKNKAFESAMNDVDLYFRTGDTALLHHRDAGDVKSKPRFAIPKPRQHNDDADTPTVPGSLRLNAPLYRYNLTSEFGMRRLGFGRAARPHEGIDMAAPFATPVFPAAPGIVIDAGRHGGYGNAVLIDHGHGVYTHYAHLSKITVREGQSVHPGQILGKVGSTGHSTGNHLHFEIMVHDRNGRRVQVDPEKFMGRDLGDSATRKEALRDSGRTFGKPGF